MSDSGGARNINVFVEDGRLNLNFNDIEQRTNASQDDLELELEVDLIYKKRNGRIVNVNRMITAINYNTVRSRTIILKPDIDYDVLGVQVWIDGVSMYENEIGVANELF